MSTTSTLFLTDIIDNQSKEGKSAEALVRESDWRFFQLGNYTSVSPLTITQGATSKISFQANNISFSDGSGLSLNYDFTNQKFLPQTLRDVFLVEVRFKCKASAQNSHADILLECPSVAYNPIQAYSFSVVKAANTEQFVSVSVPIFIGQDLITNGLEVKIASNSGTFSVYDVSFMLIRVASGA